MNVLCGVGILSTPYAVKEGGWVGLSILFIFAVLSLYTGILLRHCLDSQPGLETYPDIGQAAFGTTGRFAVSACCVEHIILESDNLSSLFPNAHISVGGYELNAHQMFAVLSTLAVLPTVWLRDLSVLSYISVGGVIASIVVVICLFWVGLVDKVGFQSKGTTINLTTLPVAIGLYGYCYSGHAVFPNIYTSMEKPSQYPAVLLTRENINLIVVFEDSTTPNKSVSVFGICTLMYAGVAVMGYMMFGESTLSQFTLNMPQHLVASKIAVWTTTKELYSLLVGCSSEKVKLKIKIIFNVVLNYNHICINHNSGSIESGGTDPVKPSQISHVLDPNQNSTGDFDLVCGSRRSLLRSGDGIHWIFTYYASDLDTSLCLFLKHLEGENNSISGTAKMIL
ncbi:transmembrane amino acid transporter family protein [Actinidia rufa]|uniref:Transmembrane amino acid transporter family protein n=1 Tax=Actinidia rufa TaxID=165716 RepID=A0A7J0GKF1_9ERIC|nr:transmembrane amino acid transporter family protein [Actinidia rufa]